MSDKRIHKSLGFDLKKYIYIYISFRNVIKANIVFCLTAGKATTDEELEEMLDGGNAAVFTAGVSTTLYILLCVMFC